MFNSLWKKFIGNFVSDVPINYSIENLVDGEPRLEISGTRVTFLIWNLHKAKDQGFEGDFTKLMQGIDIALLQEGTTKTPFVELLKRQGEEYDWDLGVSFAQKGGHRTGCVTGSRIFWRSIQSVKTKDLEPFIKTPKVTLFTEHAIQGRTDTLMCANIHGINWAGNEALENQLTQAEKIFNKHKGPQIFAGDFNTKNSTRRKMLEYFAAKNGFNWIYTAKRDGLDHVLIKGLSVVKCQGLAVDSSDHNPIIAILEIM